MKTPALPSLLLLALAAALYFLPDGFGKNIRLAVRGSVIRIFRESNRLPPGDDDRIPDLLDRMAQKDAEIAKMRRELRDIGESRDKIPGMVLTPAEVIRLGPGSERDMITLDVGGDDNVTIGNAVVVGQALAGVVVEVDPRASLALLLSSTGCYIPARASSPSDPTGELRQDLCAVRGNGDGGVNVLVFSPDTGIQPGWIVFTSGLGGGLPEGLIIGEVLGAPTDGREPGVMEAPLKPRAPISSLDRVVVAGKSGR